MCSSPGSSEARDRLRPAGRGSARAGGGRRCGDGSDPLPDVGVDLRRGSEPGGGQRRPAERTHRAAPTNPLGRARGARAARPDLEHRVPLDRPSRVDTAMTYPALRKTLLAKLGVSPQRLYQRVARRKLELPTGTPEAAHTTGWDEGQEASIRSRRRGACGRSS